MKREDGFTAVTAIIVLLIVTGFASSALAFGLRSMSTSQRDRSSARALAAADAGADRAGYLLNRTLVSSGTAGLLGLAVDTLRTVSCVKVTAAGYQVISTAPQGGFCADGISEDLGNGSSYEYRMTTNVNLGTTLGETLVRRVVSTGLSGGVKRRVLVTYRLDIDPAHITSLWKRWRYVECSPTAATGQPADNGCPDPGL